MACHGHIGEFTGDADDCTAFAKRLEYSFTTNKVTNAEKKRAILLSCCGASMRKLIRHLTAPGKVTDYTFDEIIKEIKAHYCPKLSQIAHHLSSIAMFKEQQCLFLSSLWN